MKGIFDAIKSNDLDKVNRLIANANVVAMLVNQAIVYSIVGRHFLLQLTRVR